MMMDAAMRPFYTTAKARAPQQQQPPAPPPETSAESGEDPPSAPKGNGTSTTNNNNSSTMDAPDNRDAVPATAATEDPGQDAPLTPADSYVRARDLARPADRRRVLTGWMDEQGLLAREEEEAAIEEEEEEDVEPVPTISGGTIPCSVLYARACGPQQAWLVLLKGASRPYVVVRGDSPAADHLLRVALMERAPPYASPSATEGESQSTRHGATIELRDDPRTWAAMRESVLEPRRVVFHLSTLPEFDEEDPRGPEWSDQFPLSLSPASMMLMTPNAAAVPMHHDGGRGWDPEVEWQAMVDAMGNDAQWLAPLIESELMGPHSPEPLLPLTEPGHHHHHDGPEEPEYLPPYRPRLRAGLDAYDAHAVEEAAQLMEMVHEADREEEMRLMATVARDSDEGPLSPYEDPGVMLWSKGGKRQADRAQRELRRGLGHGFHRFFAALGFVDPPAEDDGDSESRVPTAGGGEDEDAPVPVPSPRQMESGGGHQEHEEAEDPPTPDAVFDLQTSSTPQAVPGSEVEEEEAQYGKPEGHREPGPVGPLDTTRAGGTVERAMVEGEWYRMTVREFTVWRCGAQFPLIEGSLLRCLERGTDSNTSRPLPRWLVDSLGSGAVAHKLARAMRSRLPPLVALADAQERLVAAAQEAAACGQETGDGGVRVDARVWRSMCHAAETVEHTHRRCLQDSDRTSDESTANTDQGPAPPSEPEA